MDREQILFRLFGKYCPEGTILSTEGSPGQEMYVIQSGGVRLGAARPPGGRAGILGPGDLFGEGCFFARPPRSARAEVVQDARLIQVSDRTLDAVVRHDPRTAHAIFDHLQELMSAAASDMHHWTLGQLLPRIAPVLSSAPGGGFLPADLAEQSGLGEADVLLVLEELQRRGCLVREGQRFRAPDAALLRREIEGLAAAGGRA